jgi:dephospho-CoA kinase
MKDRIIIGVTGMPGSGKSTFAEVARKLGFKIIVMGDFLRKEAEARKVKPTSENLGKLMIKIRKEKGEKFLAKLTVKAVKAVKGRKILIDGVRSLAELEEFKYSFPDFKLIAIHAPQEFRFKRISGRARSDDPSAWRNFIKRELRELKVGIGSAIALADRIIENSGSLKEFKNKAAETLTEMVKNV